MMPFCDYKRCNHVATTKLGSIDVPNNAAKTDSNPRGIHPQVIYVCDKHYVKIIKLLGLGHLLKGD